MRLDNDARLWIYWDATLTFNPTGSTAVLNVDGTPYALTWLGSPVAADSRWTQTARTNVRFCGSLATALTGDVKLTAGRRIAEPIVTLADSQIVPCYPEIAIDVQ